MGDKLIYSLDKQEIALKPEILSEKIYRNKVYWAYSCLCGKGRIYEEQDYFSEQIFIELEFLTNLVHLLFRPAVQTCGILVHKAC